MSKQRMIHHISFHFSKSRVLFSVPSTTTLLELKRTFLTALPMLRSDAPGDASLPDPSPPATETMETEAEPESTKARIPLDNVKGTSDVVLWRRRGVEGMDRFGVVEGESGPEGWICLEGDPTTFGEAPGDEERGERRRLLEGTVGDQGRIPTWDRWVDVYVSFRDGDSWPEPTVQHPSLDDGEYEDEDV